jgi:hypothetical protein
MVIIVFVVLVLVFGILAVNVFMSNGVVEQKHIPQCQKRHPSLADINCCVLPQDHDGLHKTATGRVWGRL